MATELEKRNLRSYEIRQKAHKKKIFLLSVLAVIIAAVILTLAFHFISNRNYSSFKIVNTVKRSDSSSAKYLSYKSGVLRYSRDGAVAMDAAGTQLWNGTYQMKDPIVDMNGDYVAISDRGNKTVEIFDGNGGMKTVEVLYPIITTEIANQGVIAVLMQGDHVNHIEFFDKDGNSLLQARTAEEGDGFPIDIALSDDGRKMATSYVSLMNGTIQSKVTFYNFGGVGKNYINRIVGGFDCGQTIIADLEFVDNNTVAAFGDDKISIYSMEEQPELIHEEKVSSEIKSILYNEKYIGIIVNNSTEKNKYSVKLLDYKGKKILDKAFDYEFDRAFLSKDEVIMYSNQELTILRASGSEKLHYSFEKSISSVLPVKGSGKYIIVNDTNMEEVALTK